MSNGSDIKPTDLRGILKYVPRFQGQTFVIALDGIIVADDNFPNILTDIAVLRSLGIKIIIIHGIGHQLEELSKTRNIPITDLQGKGVADAATHVTIRAQASRRARKRHIAATRLLLPPQCVAAVTDRVSALHSSCGRWIAGVPPTRRAEVAT